MSEPDIESPTVGSRVPELAVALLLMAIAVLVIVDSIRVGTGWSDEGPRSGYFPFYIGVALLLSSGWVALRQLLHWRTDNPGFAQRAQLGRVWPCCGRRRSMSRRSSSWASMSRPSC